MDHPTTTLEELFLSIVRESEAHPGRRALERKETRGRRYCRPLALSRGRDGIGSCCPTTIYLQHAKGTRAPPWKSDRTNSCHLPTWFGSAIKFFVIAVPLLILLAIFICFLISAARRGPVEAFYAVAGVIATALGKDLPATSLRRILAMTRLTIKEAIRRRVIVGFVIFVVDLSVRGLVSGRQERRSGPPLPEFRADRPPTTW